MTGKPPQRRWKPKHVRRRGFGAWRWLGAGFAVLLLGAAIGAGVFVRETLAYAEVYEGRILPGVTIAGTDVGGMDREAALAAARQVADPLLDREIVVRWNDEEWHTSPRALGSGSDAEAVVDDLLTASRNVTWTHLAAMRWGDARLDLQRDVAVTHHNGEALTYLRSLADTVNRAATDAELEVVDGWVSITPHEVGYETRLTTSHERLVEALEQGHDGVALQVATVEPEITVDEYDTIILLRQQDHRVYLYEQGEIAREWRVAVGGAGYATPTGMYHVTAKRHMPTWINPAPDGWGASMPARIGPGRSNPLGVRALNWDVGAIRFHGTENINSIGTNASKGCVRFTNAEIVEFYDLVEVGTPIVSVRA